MRWRVFVPGRPVPQGSLRPFAHPSTGRVIVPQAQQVVEYRAELRRRVAEMGVPEVVGPVRVEVEFVFARPKSHFRTGRFADELRPAAPAYHLGRPDIDKLLRTVLDGLGGADTAIAGAVFADDSQVVEALAVKRWAQRDEPAGVWIGVEAVSS